MTKKQRFGLLYFIFAMAMFVTSNLLLVSDIDGYWILYVPTMIFVIVGASMQSD